MSFYDRYGNVLPNDWQDQSENPSLFNAVLFFSRAYFEKCDKSYNQKVFTRFINKYITNNRTWRTMEEDPNPDWSHDEKIAALAYFNWQLQRDWVKRIPLFASFDNSSWLSWLRPDVFAYSIAVKYPLLAPLVGWIIELKIKTSLKDFIEDPRGQSSGAQKAFVMLMGLGDMARVRELDDVVDWSKVFEIYYPQPEHPVRKTWVGCSE